MFNNSTMARHAVTPARERNETMQPTRPALNNNQDIENYLRALSIGALYRLVGDLRADGNTSRTSRLLERAWYWIHHRQYLAKAERDAS